VTALCSVVLFFPATKYPSPMPVEPRLVKFFLLVVRHANYWTYFLSASSLPLEIW